MSEFPLYDTVKKSIKIKNFTIKHKTQLIKNIQELDDASQELIYALIKYYYNINSKNQDEIPYNGKISRIPDMKNCYSLTWDLSNLPSELNKILLTFVELHLQSKSEENTRIQENKKTNNTNTLDNTQVKDDDKESDSEDN